MILFLTITKDKDVDIVIEEIKILNIKAKIFRLNFDQLTKFSFLLDINMKLLILNGEIITSIYMRKYSFNYIEETITINNELYFDYFKNEIETLLSAISYLKLEINILGTFNSNSNNKLIQLLEAKNAGFEIPKTIITNNKNNLIKNKNYITKGIKNNPIFKYKNFENMMFIKKVNPKYLPNRFYPSLFQEMIEKDFEIRIFFMKNKFYGLAFLNTEIDVRNTNEFNLTEFNIPMKLKLKINALCENLTINTGSIDILVKNDIFYFLEINTSGIYDMLAKPLNAALHKVIAKELLMMN